MNPAVTPDCDYMWVGLANLVGAATGTGIGFKGSPLEIKRRRWVLCGGKPWWPETSWTRVGDLW